MNFQKKIKVTVDLKDSLDDIFKHNLRQQLNIEVLKQ